MSIIMKTLLEISFLSSIMIMLVMAIKAIWVGEISIKIISFLWLLVLIRLILPITLESPLHFDSLLPETIEVIQEEQPVINQNGETSTSTNDVFSDYPNLVNYEDISPNYLQETTVVINETSLWENSIKYIKKISLWSWAFIVWIIGSVSILARSAYLGIKFSRKTNRIAYTHDKDLNSLLDEAKVHVDVHKRIPIFQSIHVDVPVVFGVFKPKIIIPARLYLSVSRDKLKLIILHELCHIKRKDTLINILWLAAKALHWFNPLVWVAYNMYLDDIELACDELVISKISEEDGFEYSQSLLDVIKLSKKRQRLPIALSFCNDKNKLRKRVMNMVKPQRKLKSAGFVCILLSVIMIIGCFTTACQSSPKENVAKAEVADVNTDELTNVTEESIDTSNAQELKTSDVEVEVNHIDKVIDAESDNLHITIDADVYIPQTEFSEADIIFSKITQQQVDAFLDRFFPERLALPGDEITQIPTKDQIQKNIDMTQEWIDTNEVNSDRYGVTNHERWQSEIDFYKEQLKDAPEEKAVIPEYDITKFSFIPLMEVEWFEGMTIIEMENKLVEMEERAKKENSELINYNIKTTDNEEYRVYVLRSDDPYINMFNVSTNAFKSYSDIIFESTEDIPELNMTFDEAKSMADEAATLLGLDYMDVAYSGIEMYEERISTSDSRETGKVYYFVYTRDINGVNKTYTQNILQWSEENTRPLSYENFEIRIDDGGIQTVFLSSCPSVIGETLTNNVSLLEFDDIMTTAEQSFNSNILQHSRNSYEVGRLLEENRATVYENNIIIDKIVLGYMRVKQSDELNDYMYIPVWDFIGRESIRMDIENKSSGEIFEVTTEMPEDGYGDEHSFLTVNAIDGSIIDRGAGY